jgi:hypothetical protein
MDDNRWVFLAENAQKVRELGQSREPNRLGGLSAHRSIG